MAKLTISSGDLRKALAQVLEKGDDVLIHSSLKAIGNFSEGIPDICDALVATVGAEGTVVMMTHTTSSFVQTGCFSLSDRSESGLLSEQFRRRPNALRSKVPMVSFAAEGMNAHEYTRSYQSHLDEDATLTRLIKNNGKILLFGVGYKKCTLYHLSEERKQTDTNEYKNFSGYLIEGGKKSPISQRYFVRKDINVQKDGANVKDKFEANYSFKEVQLGSGKITVFSARDFDECCMDAINCDPDFFLVDPIKFD